MEEIGLRLGILTTTKNLTSFHKSPRNFETSFYGSPEFFKQFFIEVNRSPHLSTKWPGKPSNLEIQMF